MEKKYNWFISNFFARFIKVIVLLGHFGAFVYCCYLQFTGNDRIIIGVLMSSYLIIASVKYADNYNANKS